MEKKANAKIDDYISNMQHSIIHMLQNGESSETVISHIQQYSKFSLESEDFTKRKRVKNYHHINIILMKIYYY